MGFPLEFCSILGISVYKHVLIMLCYLHHTQSVICLFRCNSFFHWLEPKNPREHGTSTGCCCPIVLKSLLKSFQFCSISSCLIWISYDFFGSVYDRPLNILSSCSNLPCDDALVPSIRIQWCSNFGLTRQRATNAKLLMTIGNMHLRSLSVKIQRPMLK